MSGGLPASIDVIRLADQAARLSGTIPLKRMKRLLASCRSETGEVSVDLEFHSDAERGLRSLSGKIETVIETTCERCLEPMQLALSADVGMLIVTGTQSIAGDDQSDVLQVDGPVALDELVENELILAMPMIPMHPAEQCPASGLIGTRPSVEDGKAEAEAESSPFAKLAELKRDKRENE
jgi:uncharacterized protein